MDTVLDLVPFWEHGLDSIYDKKGSLYDLYDREDSSGKAREAFTIEDKQQKKGDLPGLTRGALGMEDRLGRASSAASRSPFALRP